MPGLLLFFIVLALPAVYGVFIFNQLVTLKHNVGKAWSNIDVVLKQRHDQLPALVSAVRGALAFEQDTLTEVARARAAYSPTEPIPDQAVHSDQTTLAVRSLFAVVERYPDLTSQQNVLDLQDEIERLESMIADRRELYNDQVFRYNTRIAQVPANMLAAVLGWRPEPFFAAEDADRERPAASLDLA